ncbi:hypothetical protein JOF56_010526 [Kibdelosporangium banguiense]|uniref:Uncharacterized protein n=1 Tax=Kibdelosporangium banguiense TaxID=1365924 RepID=A0ABS4U0I1_9PSEU|nr:effector-associated domain EAD1-containing protein [Kibdelosporangium banguiense]MBP2330141.1 hypothetical protein [Kibdelosporangium banguiense]
MTRWIDAPDWSDPAADTLVKALAHAYPKPAAAEDVWRRTGMSQLDFPLGWNNARQLWTAAVQQAHLAGYLEKLITTARDEWPALREKFTSLLNATAQCFTSSPHLLDLTLDQQTELQRILGGATETESVAEIYHDVRRGVAGLPPYPGDLWRAVQTLRGAVNAFPLCEFLARLACGPDKVTGNALWSWLRRNAPHWTVNVDELDRIGKIVKRTIISVRVLPDLLTPDFHVTVWLYSNSEGWQAAASSTEPWSWQRIAEQLGRLLREIESVRGGEPIVEFTMPVQMLEAPVDKLMVDLTGRAYPIGTLCPVIVRPLGREISAAHVEKWKRLKESDGRFDAGAFQLVTAGSVQPLQDVLCVGIIRAVDTPPEALAATLTAVFDAGIPVVLWHRATPYRYTNTTPLNSILLERPVSRLQDVVREQREAASARHALTSHPGRDVVLLWDNPHRIPPDPTWLPPI